MSKSKQDTVVLVTGANGFIGSYVVVELLKEGYKVRASARNEQKVETARISIREAGFNPDDVEFYYLDILSDKNWAQAMNGVDYVQHVAAPVPSLEMSMEPNMIENASEGIQRMLKFSTAASVKRVVLMSSMVSIVFGHQNAPIDESMWTDLNDPAVNEYAKSKTLAERAAWKFVKETPGAPELTTTHPTLVLGPMLGKNYSASNAFILSLLTGKMPVLMDIRSAIVDVRDTAKLHVLAMTHPKAAGERFFCTANDKCYTFAEVAAVLREGLGPKAAKVPRMVLPNWAVHILGLFSTEIHNLIGYLGKDYPASSAKAQRLLGFNPRPVKGTILDCANDLIDKGMT